jgi:hypothetical protein
MVLGLGILVSLLSTLETRGLAVEKWQYKVTVARVSLIIRTNEKSSFADAVGGQSLPNQV